MYDRILRRMQERIRRREYVVTLHARKEMNDDRLSIYDIERGVLSGEILERQRDRGTRETKYRIRGQNLEEAGIEVVAKISPTGKLVIITVYAL